MKVSQTTARTVTPIIRAMTQAGTLPRSEANTLCNLIREASQPAKAAPIVQQKPRMVSAAHMAAALGVCTKTILRMRENGQLKGKRITGSAKSLRFSEDEIQHLINTEGFNHES